MSCVANTYVILLRGARAVDPFSFFADPDQQPCQGPFKAAFRTRMDPCLVAELLPTVTKNDHLKTGLPAPGVQAGICLELDPEH